MSEYYYNPDQAGELRRMVQTDKKALLNSGFHAISILSGKGGVGKSNVAAGLSFALADSNFQRGKRDTNRRRFRDGES